MKRSQELEIELNKKRQLILDMPDDGGAEQVGEIAEIRQSMSLINEKITVAKESEAEAQAAAEAAIAAQAGVEGHQETETAEQREFVRIGAEAEIRDFLQAFQRHEAIDNVRGAAAEFRAAIYGQDTGSEWMPLEMLLDAEERAATTLTAIQKNQSNIAGRVFGRGDAAYLGVSQPTVGIGEVAYSHLATGVVPAAQNEGANVDQTAATVTTVSLLPARIGAQYLFGIETTGRVIGIEEVLRADLRAATSDANDNLVINGKAADPNIDGMIDNLANPTDPTADLTGLLAHAGYWNAVDGKLAYRGDNVRMLVNVGTIQAMSALTIGTNGPLVTDRYGDGVLRASARMPVEAATLSTYLLFKPAAIGYAVNPIWNGIAFIRDVYTNARAGQIAITAHMLTNFDLVRTEGHVRGEFKTS